MRIWRGYEKGQCEELVTSMQTKRPSYADISSCTQPHTSTYGRFHAY